jgi:hypothetical protein
LQLIIRHDKTWQVQSLIAIYKAKNAETKRIIPVNSVKEQSRQLDHAQDICLRNQGMAQFVRALDDIQMHVS